MEQIPIQNMTGDISYLTVPSRTPIYILTNMIMETHRNLIGVPKLVIMKDGSYHVPGRYDPVERGYTYHLIMSDDPYEIYIQYETRSYWINIRPSTTIGEIKAIIREDYPEIFSTPISLSPILEDHQTARELGIGKHHELLVTVL